MIVLGCTHINTLCTTQVPKSFQIPQKPVILFGVNLASCSWLHLSLGPSVDGEPLNGVVPAGNEWEKEWSTNAVTKQMHAISERPSCLSSCQLSVLMECHMPASHWSRRQGEVLSWGPFITSFCWGLIQTEFWRHSFVYERNKRSDSSVLLPKLHKTVCVLCSSGLSKDSHHE